MWGSWTSGVASCMAAILMWIIFKMQDNKISRNQFDAIFFDMLRTFREIRTETIEKEIEQFVDEYKAHFVLNVQIEKLDILKIKAIMMLFVDIHEKGKSFLSYFRYIERIATYIDSDEQFNEDSLKSATYWVSWDFACKTTKIHFIVHIPCITETS